MKKILSKKNEYYLPKFRYLELKYFVRQYGLFKRLSNEMSLYSSSVIKVYNSGLSENSIENSIIFRERYIKYCKMIENAAYEVDSALYCYILYGVCNGYTYDTIKAKYGVPCGRVQYYKLCRQFYWVLNLHKI